MSLLRPLQLFTRNRLLAGAWRAAAAALLLAALAQPGTAPLLAAPVVVAPVVPAPAPVAPLDPQGSCLHTVSSTSDSVPGSLRAAVHCATLTPNHTVTFSSTLTNQVVNVTAGDITVTVPITIDGSGAPGVMVDAGQLSRVFNISASGTVTVKALTLQHGNGGGGNGGAVFAGAATTVVLDQVQVLSSTALFASGGGLYSANTAILSDTQFISNTSLGDGGGVYVTGVTVVSNGRFERNVCNGINCEGGGLNPGALTVSGTQFISNTSNGQGGGLWAFTSASVSNAQFQNNKCINSACEGGGLYASSTLALTSTDFISNTSVSHGGGAWAALGATLTNGRFQGNKCSGAGCQGGGLAAAGPTLAIAGTDFVGNASDLYGGGVVAIGTVTLTNGSFQGNKCTDSVCQGGGLVAGGTLTMTGTNFISNTSVLYGGGAVAGGAATLTNGSFQGNQCTDSLDGCNGGGLAVSNTLTLNGTNFISNTSTSNGGGVFAQSAALLTNGRFERNVCTGAGCLGGGLDVSGTLTLNGTNFITNTSVSRGGGLNVPSAATLTDGSFQGNQCTGTGCEGGGLHDGSALTLTNTDFISNTSTSNGGGAAASQAAVTNGSFQRNRCTDLGCQGGGLFAVNTMIVTGTQFISNSSFGPGGGAAGLIVRLTNAPFQGNRCTGSNCSGGGVMADALTLRGTQFIGNTSVRGGGGARAQNARVFNTLFQNNACTVAGCLGGGLWLNLSNSLVYSSSFSDNQSAGLGGAIGITGSAQITLANVTLSSNLASTAGGGLFANSGTRAGLFNVTLADNQAPNGGGLRAEPGATVGISNTLFSNNSANNCSGPIANGTHNLEWPGGDCAAAGGPSVGFTTADPLLAPLALNLPGTTLTRALLNDSPARDAGDPATCANAPVNNIDQRGVIRPIRGLLGAGPAICDIGAFEAGPPMWFLFLPAVR